MYNASYDSDHYFDLIIVIHVLFSAQSETRKIYKTLLEESEDFNGLLIDPR